MHCRGASPPGVIGPPSRARRTRRETNVSAKCPPSGEAPWIPTPHVHARRAEHREVSAPEGKAEAVRLIRGIRGQRSFVSLRREGRRSASGALWVTFHADATDHLRLAFAIPRSSGTAVQRNRARRQLRAVFGELANEEPDLVATGDYLLGVRRSEFTSAEARAWLTAALRQLKA